MFGWQLHDVAIPHRESVLIQYLCCIMCWLIVYTQHFVDIDKRLVHRNKYLVISYLGIYTKFHENK